MSFLFGSREGTRQLPTSTAARSCPVIATNIWWRPLVWGSPEPSRDEGPGPTEFPTNREANGLVGQKPSSYSASQQRLMVSGLVTIGGQRRLSGQEEDLWVVIRWLYFKTGLAKVWILAGLFNN